MEEHEQEEKGKCDTKRKQRRKWDTGREDGGRKEEGKSQQESKEEDDDYDEEEGRRWRRCKGRLRNPIEGGDITCNADLMGLRHAGAECCRFCSRPTRKDGEIRGRIWEGGAEGD